MRIVLLLFLTTFLLSKKLHFDYSILVKRDDFYQIKRQLHPNRLIIVRFLLVCIVSAY